MHTLTYNIRALTHTPLLSFCSPQRPEPMDVGQVIGYSDRGDVLVQFAPGDVRAVAPADLLRY